LEPIDIKTVKLFRKAIEAASGPIALVAHVNADGDAIGSVLGLSRVLRNAGKQTVVLAPNHFPPYYKWIAGAEEILIFSQFYREVRKALASSGMMICLDLNSPARTADMKELLEKYRKSSIVIDHHPFPQKFTNLLISHPECSSTAELVFHVIKQMGYREYIDMEAAEALYCGIMTDTGSFDFNISDPQTFRTVSELLEWKIDPIKIHEKVYDNYSADRMRLLGYCLCECMNILPEYHTAVMHLSRDIQQKFNFLPGDNEGFVNYPLSIKDIHFSVLFTEKDDHIKVSFRSKGDFPTNDMAAKYFNGGGHKNASGGELKVPFEKAIELFYTVLPDYKELLEATRRG
jgi:phosphoesterase RecJ-like protein